MTTKKISKGKKFEEIFKDSVLNTNEGYDVPRTIIERLPDQVTKYRGSKNPSDFIAFRTPHMYYFECKSTSATSLSFDNITQWEDLLERSRVDGVIAGVVIWFYAKDVTIFVDIRLLECMRQEGYKSISYDLHWTGDEKLDNWIKYYIKIQGEKRRVYFEYDMNKFFDDVGTIYDNKRTYKNEL